jgi:hypothetical protein
VSEHLDANTVAAFVASSLTPDERSQVFEHLADCESCREWIATCTELKPRHIAPPVWALAAAAAVACGVFAWWLTTGHPTPTPATARRVQLPATMTIMDLDPLPQQDALPGAWKQVRLVPDLPMGGLKPTPHRISLQTTVGEKWITLDGAWGSVVP